MSVEKESGINKENDTGVEKSLISLDKRSRIID
jgi:hypothetical protein